MLGRMGSTGAGGRGASTIVTMINDEQSERSVKRSVRRSVRRGREEGAWAKMLVLDHTWSARGATFGQKMLFCPRKALRICPR